ncbi:MAG TPA: hypothetical protein VFU12_00245 [Glycomyces sp.]|nr:hypothetical protein [Glycomyces sp.]
MTGQSGSLRDPLVVMLADWVLSAALGVALAATALAIMTGAYWTALFFTSRIMPVVDEDGDRLRGATALGHVAYRWKVWLGHVSFFPYRPDHSWLRILRFHFILLSLIGFGEVLGILLDEGERPLHLSLMTFFLPSLITHLGAIFPNKGSAATGIVKRQGPGPSTRRRFFTDEEIAERKAAERRQREATRRFWRLQRER